MKTNIDKAIFLFTPCSKFAPRPAINIVKLEINNKTYLITNRNV